MKARVILDTPPIDKKGKQGPTKREHLQNLEDQGVKDPKRNGFGLDDGFAPEGGEKLWAWFWDLHKRRRSGFGVERISFEEIQAWSAMTQNRPTLLELKMLEAMDDVWMSAYQKTSQKKGQGKNGRK